MDPETTESPDRETLKRRYALINWNAHLVPVVREAVAHFGAHMPKGRPMPQVALRSDIVGRSSSAETGDALTIQFGVCGGVEVAAPPGHARLFITPGRPALVFAQTFSGGVSLFLYPTGETGEEPTRVAHVRDPADLSRSRVRQLLRSLFARYQTDAPRPVAMARSLRFGAA